jgi:hypothetical protein
MYFEALLLSAMKKRTENSNRVFIDVHQESGSI